MNVIEDIIIKLKALKSELNATIEQALRDNEKEIIRLNYDGQLYNKGINRNGEKIKPPYAKSRCLRFWYYWDIYHNTFIFFSIAGTIYLFTTSCKFSSVKPNISSPYL